MCFNKEVSLGSFLLGLISSYMLINYGNKKYEIGNKIIGYFFMFVSLMQLIDYLIWVDLKCDKGFNKVAGVIGPLLNHLQPTILFLLCNAFLPKTKYTNYIYLFNGVYVVYTMVMYFMYLQNGKLCSDTNDSKHIHWVWKHSFNYLFYQMMMFFNMIAFLHDKVTLISMIISYIFFFISYKYFHTNIGELWCYFVVYIPLLILVGQQIK